MNSTASRNTSRNLRHDDFIQINVCGMVYETLRSTLKRYPTTLLGDNERLKDFYVPSRDIYFFDRHRDSFGAILYYYQSHGTLLRPDNVPLKVFERELRFFSIQEEVITELLNNEGHFHGESTADDIELPKSYLKRKIWELFEIPTSSILSRIIACWSIFIVIVSILLFCLETLPVFQIKSQKIHTQHVTSIQPWFTLELICIVWFSFEYLARFFSAPNKLRFLKSFLNFIDLLAILPYFIMLILRNTDTAPLFVLRIIRLVRVFRVFKLVRHSNGLQVLCRTLKASASELSMLAFFMSLGIVLFSSAVYYAEQEHPNGKFSSIPDAFWYTLVTMTTVGYGDQVPVTLAGKLVGSFCSLSGILTVALPLPIIASNFQFYYNSSCPECNRQRVSSVNMVNPADSLMVHELPVRSDNVSLELQMNNKVENSGI